MAPGDEGKAELLDHDEVMAAVRAALAPEHSTLTIDQWIVWHLGWQELARAYEKGFQAG